MQIAQEQDSKDDEEDTESMEENGGKWRYFAANVLVLRHPIGILCLINLVTASRQD